MGLIVLRKGQPFVLEAIAHVQLTPLTKWAARGEKGRYVVKRLRDDRVLRDPAKLAALRKAALSFAGRPYDPYFEWTDDRIYCSELVWKAYERALGVRLGPLASLDSFDLSSRLVQAKMTERYGRKVPLGERVISPAAIFNSPLLEVAR
jgi:permuted papain-like amidase YaeF/Yiix C92 family enzyme